MTKRAERSCTCLEMSPARKASQKLEGGGLGLTWIWNSSTTSCAEWFVSTNGAPVEKPHAWRSRFPVRADEERGRDTVQDSDIALLEAVA